MTRFLSEHVKVMRLSLLTVHPTSCSAHPPDGINPHLSSYENPQIYEDTYHISLEDFILQVLMLAGRSENMNMEEEGTKLLI